MMKGSLAYHCLVDNAVGVVVDDAAVDAYIVESVVGPVPCLELRHYFRRY